MASETKFTPGPWSQGSRNRDCVWLQGKKEPGYGMGEGFDWIDCNSEANASLIAAAPDLYEALVMARQELCGLPHSLGYSFTHIPNIDAALAKARGEA